MLPDNSERLTQLAQARHNQTLERATVGLASMPPGEVITVTGLATSAGVSRSWLYTQPDLLEKIEKLNHSRGGAARSASDSRASTESNRRRLEIAHDRIIELTKENRELRDAVARMHGQVREEAIRF
ncbi:MAG TPA: DUF6262 family protein [Acidimicrobiales bacterium]|jgi:hypothetical protein|nr:DUF6262 family protein [Acidimicrobiales bacterium]